jgi:hypothetical protein
MKQLEENRINTERQLTMQATSYLDNMAAEALTAGITAWALLKDRKKEAMA